MKLSVQVVLHADDGTETVVHERAGKTGEGRSLAGATLSWGKCRRAGSSTCRSASGSARWYAEFTNTPGPLALAT
jgi:hypothetical protein